ncbi:uncharacterized protein J5F26_014046 [Ciconia maguari]
MANALSWLILFCSLRIFVRGTSSLSPDCSIDCQTHCLIDCRQGHYYTAGNCLECPTGFYCPGGQAAPRKCPLGTANELTAQADITACQVCPNGYLSLGSGAGCRACPDGYSCDPRSGVQRSCSPGQYSPEGELECQECPERYVCPDGRSRQHCLDGQQPNPSRTYCVTGTPGSFSAEDTLLHQPCPAGTGLCLKCPAGYFCPTGASYPVPCQPGTYNPLQGQDEAADCRACLAGRACTQAGLAQPDAECLPGGTYRMEQGAKVAADCIPCPGGYYCPELGTVTPRTCGAGNFSDQGSASCLLCLVGHYCASEHTSWEVMLLAMICPAGLLCPEGQAVVPDASANACPRGYYCPRGDTDLHAKPCPNGTYGEQRGLSSADECLPCPTGKYCYRDGIEPPGIPHPKKTTKPCLTVYFAFQTGDCPPGYKCPPGTGFPFSFPCMPGFLWDNSSVESEDTCKPCPPAYYCDSPAMSEPKTCPALPTDGVTGDVCPAGSYCPPGSPLPIPCPPGTYSNVSGLRSIRECLDCPPGLYCDGTNNQAPSGPCKPGYFCTGGARSALQQVVMEGHYSLTGAFKPEPCPLGSFQPECSVENGDYPLQVVPAGQDSSAQQEQVSQTLAEPQTRALAAHAHLDTSAQLAQVSPSNAPWALTQTGTRFATEFPCPRGYYNPDPMTQSLDSCLPCPPGHYCGQENLTAASGKCDAGLSVPSGECTAGFYCNGGAALPKPTDGVTGNICPVGTYCTAASAVPKLCPAGTFSSLLGRRMLSECQPCPSGFYCEVPGLSAPTGECWEGYYCDSQQGPVTDFTLYPCPRGFYCPPGTNRSTQYSCPAGTFGPRQKLKTIEECQRCPPGKYCEFSGLAAPTGDCAEGFWCKSGARVRNPQDGESGLPCPPGHYCPEGYFCPKGTALPTACPAGSYNPLQRQASCLSCPRGFFCPKNSSSFLENECSAGHYCPTGTASATQFPCPKGTYNAQTGSSLMSHCTPCDPGHYCALPGQSHVTGPCLAGFYCSGGVSSPTPTDGLLGNTCPKGTYCPMGSAFPQPCPPGYYSNSSGNTGIEDCLLCDAGYFCNGTGLVSPAGLCEAGFYCSGGTISPKPLRTTARGGPCPPGHYCVVGSSRAQPCPAGSYSPSWSMAQCLECPEGFYCTTASTNYTDCPAGHYCPRNTEFATQYPCPPGTYSEVLNIWDASKCQLCPPGRVCSKPGLARPDGLCMPGWFCPPGSTSSKPMFPGNYSGMAAPASGSLGLCQAGTFCPAGSFLPLPCTPGLYCATAELAAPSGPCEAGFYCTGGSTLPNPVDGAVGNICPRGHFCPAGSSSPSPCPPGSFLAHRGGQSAEDCQACFPGWFCSQRGQSSPEGLCKEGWFCPEGSVSGQHSDYLCPVGHYCPTGSPEPIPCPSGKYQDQAGKSQCETCPAGMFCALKDHPGDLQENFSHGVVKPIECPAGYYCPSGTKVANQYPCPEGTYSNQTGLGNPRECKPCPGGTFCASAGLLSPSGPCLPGYYCTSKAHIPRPVNDEAGDLCPAGHYCPPGSSKPEPCPTGTFLPQSGMVYRNACLPCPGGKFCQGEGLASVSGTCYAGYFCDLGSTQPDHKHCPPGFYCPEGSESPVPCSPGSFNSDSGKWRSTDCQLCPAGYFCSGSGAHTPELCPAGYFCLPGTNFSTEHPCPKGTFGPRTGATSESDCEPCPAGMYCSAPGLSQPSGLCYSGYHCAKGAVSPAPFKHRVESSSLGLPGNDICPVGHFCPSGTGYPLPCPPGSFSTIVGLEAEEQCQPCPAGRYCSGAGLSDLAQTSLCNAGYVCLEGNSAPCPSDGIHGYRCPRGFYCPVGTGLELPCEPGTFSPVPGASVCIPCPAGMACSNAATVKPLSCPRGYYCPFQTAVPLPCPEGTLNTLEGAVAPTACKLCPVGRYCRGDANWEPDGLCSAGYYCEGGATDAIPHGTPAFPLSGPCPLGHYCPEGTHFPVACPVGTLNNATGGTSPESCVPCYPGSFCASIGLSSPTGPCTEGFYCPANFSSVSPTAFLCPKGHFCRSGAAHPTPCPAGEYQPARGSASCIPCQRGFYCQELVAGDPKRCPPHSYCPTGTWVPLTCPEGTFTPANMTGLWNEKECLPCLPGHYCRRGRLEGKCAAGYFCLAGSSQSTPQGHGFSWRFLSGCRWGQVCAGLCPAGFYCLEGSEVPIPCPANTIRDVPGAVKREDCLPCPPGHWCKAGDSEAYPCPSGHYCFGGNGSNHSSLRAPQKCPPQTYRKHPGAQSLTDCQPCPPGYHCPLSGSVNPKPCRPGLYCGAHTAVPSVCPAGYYCPEGSSTYNSPEQL